MKCECGNETNNKAGLCAICALDRHMNGTQPNVGAQGLRTDKTKENTMSGITKSKKCQDCGNEYQPTSNVQKRCQGCAEKHKGSKNKSYRDAKKQTTLERKPSLPKNWGKVEMAIPAPATSIAPVRKGTVLAMLEAKREELREELAAVNTTILTIERYTAA